MKHQFKKNLFLLVLLSYKTTCTLTHQELEDQILHGLFKYDASFDDVINHAPQGPLKRVVKNEAVAALTGIVDAQDILQDGFYYRSNPIARRNIIDVSIFQQFNFFSQHQEEHYTWTPFYTQTYKEYYYQQHETIDKYINIKQETLVDRIDRLQLTSINLPEVFSLFSKIKLQERNAGFMFNFLQTTDFYAFSFRIPFYWVEHNFYLNKQEQDAINNHPVFAEFEGDFFEYAQQHLISDALALGDTKLQIEFLAKKTYKYELSIGGKATLPTRVRIKKGLLGNYFNINAPQYNFDLYNDLLKIPADLTAPTSAETALLTHNTTALTDALIDRLSTLLLEQGNENNHHFSIGLFAHSLMKFNTQFSLASLLSLEAVLPSSEKRFYIIKNNPAAFAAFNWDDTTVQVDEKITFLNQQFKEKFFPPAYTTRVFPGFVFQSTSALTHHCTNWDFTLGGDFWLQTKEHIRVNQKLPSDISGLLQTETAQRDRAYQSGIWIAAEKHPCNNGWQWGIKAGTTTLSSGVGKDISFALTLKNDF